MRAGDRPSLKRPLVKVIGAGESVKGQMGGEVDLTYSGAAPLRRRRLRGGRA